MMMFCVLYVVPPSHPQSSSPAQREPPPPEMPPSFHQSSSPAQRDIRPQKCHFPFISRHQAMPIARTLLVMMPADDGAICIYTV